MIEMTTFNARKNRWILARPEQMNDCDQAVMVALYLGWTQKEIADDWGVSITRIQQFKRRGQRRNKTLAATLDMAEAL